MPSADRKLSVKVRHMSQTFREEGVRAAAAEVFCVRGGDVAEETTIRRLAVSSNKITHGAILYGAIAKRWLQIRINGHAVPRPCPALLAAIAD